MKNIAEVIAQVKNAHTKLDGLHGMIDGIEIEVDALGDADGCAVAQYWVALEIICRTLGTLDNFLDEFDPRS